MAGIKGRSGRRTTSVETKRLAIIDKAWEIIGKRLNDANLTIADKVLLAKDIAIKTIPQKIEGDGLGTNVYNIISRIQQDFISGNSRPPVELDRTNGVDKG